MSFRKWISTLMNKPYLHISMKYDSNSKHVIIDTDFNKEMINSIDFEYETMKDSYDWNPMYRDNEKVLLYLSDIIQNMVEQTIDQESGIGDDLGLSNVPVMAVRGGSENKLVIDVSKARRFGNE